MINGLRRCAPAGTNRLESASGSANSVSAGVISRPAVSLAAKIHRVLEGAPDAGRVGRFITTGLFTLIALNVVAAVLDTMPEVDESLGALLDDFEFFSVAVFTLEYVTRVWVSTSDLRYRGPLLGRLRYMVTPMAIVDLLAIAPALIGLLGLDMRHLRGLRLFRLLRAAKLVRYSRSLKLIGRVLIKRRGELIGTCALMVTLLLMGSTLLYWAERDAQPDAFSSIPAAMWWAAATLTTVGYGDMTPITPIGRVLGAFVAVFGIGLFALPTGVLGAAFVEEIRGETSTCPHCGRILHQAARPSQEDAALPLAHDTRDHDAA
jgi:voltage-gated potassium channel